MKPWSRSFNGVVITANRWSDTHVEASGGGGHVGQFGGYVAAPKITSEVVQKTEIFARDANGKESSFVLSDTNVPIRVGSNIFLAWGSETGAERGPYCYIENLDTGDVYSPPTPVELKAEKWPWLARLFFFGLFLVAGRFLLQASMGSILVSFFKVITHREYNQKYFELVLWCVASYPAIRLVSVWNKWDVKKTKITNATIKDRRRDFFESIQASAALAGFKLVANDVLNMRLRRE